MQCCRALEGLLMPWDNLFVKTRVATHKIHSRGHEGLAIYWGNLCVQKGTAPHGIVSWG